VIAQIAMQQERGEARLLVAELPRLNRFDDIKESASEHDTVRAADADLGASVVANRSAVPLDGFRGANHAERFDLNTSPVCRATKARANQHGQAFHPVVRARGDEEELRVR
jgi:hypothetical protein